MADEPKKPKQKTHEEILKEFNALTEHKARVKYFQENKEVLRNYYSEGCFHQ